MKLIAPLPHIPPLEFRKTHTHEQAVEERMDNHKPVYWL